MHRAFGNWSPANPSGAFTASINEPSARGADFASLETTASENFPATFPLLLANAPDFVADTNTDLRQDESDGYGQESVLDHLGQSQARALYSEPSTSGLPAIPGVDISIADTTGGAAHPDPKYMIENFTLTDGAGHFFGPHGNCTRAGYRDTSSRFGARPRRAREPRAASRRRASRRGSARRSSCSPAITAWRTRIPPARTSRTASSSASCATPTSSSSGRTANIYLLTLHAELVGRRYIPPG